MFQQSLLVILILFFSFQLNCQNFIPYFNAANEAEFAFFSNKYRKAKIKFEELKGKFKVLKTKDYFYLGVIYYLEGDSSKGFENMRFCAVNYGFPISCINRYKTKRPKLVVSNYAISRLDSIERNVVKAKNKNMGDTLVYFESQDQLCLSHANIGDSCLITVQLNFLNFMKNYGFPNYLLYGDVSDIIFLHITNDNVFKEYEKYLLDGIKKGLIYPFYYAVMVDRRQFNLGLPSIYGAYDPTTSLDIIGKTTIENRKKIGLSIHYNGPNYSN